MNKKLKIAIIGSRGYPYVYSGYETLVKELSERLVKNGHNVRVYCHSSLFKTKQSNINGINLVYTPSFETKFLSQFVNSFFSTIHFIFSDYKIALYVNSANGPFGIITKLFRKKTCINVDGLEWLRPKWKGIGSIYYKISSKIATLFFDSIITDSVEMKKVYNSLFKKNSTVIRYGSTMTETLNDEFLKKLNIKIQDYYLIVGRLIPDNNCKLIIKEFLRTKSKKKLVIVGDVPYRDKYSEDIKLIKSERIILTGYINSQEELTQIYRNCFCYIHGHEFGGTNPTMINALDLNCNIIALKTKFNIEMLLGKNVIFFKKDLNSIFNSINQFEKKYQNIIKSNINYKLNEKYDWDIIVKQYLEVFKKLT